MAPYRNGMSDMTLGTNLIFVRIYICGTYDIPTTGRTDSIGRKRMKKILAREDQSNDYSSSSTSEGDYRMQSMTSTVCLHHIGKVHFATTKIGLGKRVLTTTYNQSPHLILMGCKAFGQNYTKYNGKKDRRNLLYCRLISECEKDSIRGTHNYSLFPRIKVIFHPELGRIFLAQTRNMNSPGLWSQNFFRRIHFHFFFGSLSLKF
jgi:hypothetical protein